MIRPTSWSAWEIHRRKVEEDKERLERRIRELEESEKKAKAIGMGYKAMAERFESILQRILVNEKASKSDVQEIDELLYPETPR